MIFALLSALGFAFEQVIDKYILSVRKVGYRKYLPLSGIIAIPLVLVILYFYSIKDFSAITIPVIGLFSLLVLIKILIDLSFFHALEIEKLTKFIPISYFRFFFTAVLIVLFYPSEFTLPLFVATMIASVFLLWSHLEKHHIVWSRGSLLFLVASFLLGLESVVAKHLIDSFGALSVTFSVILFVSIIHIIHFRARMREVRVKSVEFVGLATIIWIGSIFAQYLSYQYIGVLATTLVMVTGPLFMYFFDFLILKEKMKLKTAIATAIIVICIVYALLA